MHAFAVILAAASAVGDDNCVTYASTLCDADPRCHSFGLYNGRIQLHGCNATVPNNDWTIYAKPTGSAHGYAPLPGHVNVDESRCAEHPSTMDHACAPCRHTFAACSSRKHGRPWRSNSEAWTPLA